MATWRGNRGNKTRPASRRSEHADTDEGDEARSHTTRQPTDMLSDGYESEECSSDLVLSLLKSGIRARQSDNLYGARSQFARAARIQRSRGRQQSKLDVWLRSLANTWGKVIVRKSALDIQRVYRGMLGREECRWIKHDRMKRNKVQDDERQRARSKQEAAAKTVQRYIRASTASRNFHVMAEAGKKASAASRIQGCLRRRLLKQWRAFSQDLPRWLQTASRANQYRTMKAASATLQSYVRRRVCTSASEIRAAHTELICHLIMIRQRARFKAMTVLRSYLVSRKPRILLCLCFQSRDIIAAYLARFSFRERLLRNKKAANGLSAYVKRASSFLVGCKIVEESRNLQMRMKYQVTCQILAQAFRTRCDRVNFLQRQACSIKLQACVRRSLCLAILDDASVQSVQESDVPQQDASYNHSADHGEVNDCSAMLSMSGVEGDTWSARIDDLESLSLLSVSCKGLEEDIELLARERERISRSMVRSHGGMQQLLPHELACGSPATARLALRCLMRSKNSTG
eukprot:768503-Hanusia_phi.AAC.1